MQANGGHFNWAAIDRKALLGANIVRRRNLNYSGPPAIGQTSNLNSQTEFSCGYRIPAPEILRRRVRNCRVDDQAVTSSPSTSVVISERSRAFTAIPGCG
jgi:hypothetical protein